MESFRPQEELWEASKIAERLKRISGGALLDVATGDGDFIQVMMATLKDWDTVTGIDQSPKEIAKAKHRLGTRPNVRLFQMNAETLEFQDEAFDTVCIANSLHHLQNVETVLTEMKLTPNKPTSCNIAGMRKSTPSSANRIDGHYLKTPYNR